VTTTEERQRKQRALVRRFVEVRQARKEFENTKKALAEKDELNVEDVAKLNGECVFMFNHHSSTARQRLEQRSLNYFHKEFSKIRMQIVLPCRT